MFLALAIVCNVSNSGSNRSGVRAHTPAPFLMKANASNFEHDMGPYGRIIADTYNETEKTILIYPSESVEEEHKDAHWNISWVLEYVPNPVLEHYEQTKTESFSYANNNNDRRSSMFDELPDTSTIYHFHNQLTTVLDNLLAAYPSLVTVESIGYSVQNRELWMVELHDGSDSGEPAPAFIPLVRLVGNIHGDEAVGREMMLRFAVYLAKQHGTGGDEAVTKLLRTTRVQIIPSMNPDGFEMGRRLNANEHDLNRGFPDQYVLPEVNSIYAHMRDPEVEAILRLMLHTNCTLSISAHGGALVANYPYDATANNRVFRMAAPSPDDEFFRHVAHVYAQAHVRMAASTEFSGGVTNGGAWYQLYGGMQDASYILDDSFEITVELSKVKWPASSTLPSFWQENKPALLAYTQQAHVGVAGYVHYNYYNSSGSGSGSGGVTTETVEVCVDGIDKPIRTRVDGSYIRLLAPGNTYVLRVCGSPLASGEIYVPNPTPGVQSELVYVNLTFDV